MMRQYIQVHILEMRDDLAIEGNDSHRRALLPRMKKNDNLSWSLNVKVRQVRPDGVVYIQENGEECFHAADTVLYAVGMRPRADVVDALRGAADVFIAAGDCVKPRFILNATYEGMCAAFDI